MAEHRTSKDTHSIINTMSKNKQLLKLTYEISNALPSKKEDRSTINKFFLNVLRELTSLSV